MLRTLRFEWIAVVAVSCNTISVKRFVVDTSRRVIRPIGNILRQHSRDRERDLDRGNCLSIAQEHARDASRNLSGNRQNADQHGLTS